MEKTTIPLESVVLSISPTQRHQWYQHIRRYHSLQLRISELKASFFYCTALSVNREIHFVENFRVWKWSCSTNKEIHQKIGNEDGALLQSEKWADEDDWLMRTSKVMTLKAYAIVIPFAVINIPRTGTLLELSRSPIAAGSVPTKGWCVPRALQKRTEEMAITTEAILLLGFDERF